MALDPSIYGALNYNAPIEMAKLMQPTSMADTLKTALQIKNAQGQGQLQDMQIQQARQAVTDAQTSRAIHSQYGGDPEALSRALMKAGMSGEALKITKDIRDTEHVDSQIVAEKAKARRDDLAARKERLAQVNQYISAATDPQSYTLIRGQLAQDHGEDLVNKYLPPEYDSSKVKALGEATRTEENRVDEALRRLDQQETKAYHAQQAADAAASRGVTMRGQDIAAQTAANAQRAAKANDEGTFNGAKAPPGFRFKPNGDLEEIPGGQKAQEKTLADKDRERAKFSATEGAQVTAKMIDGALANAKKFSTTGAVGAGMRRIPGSDAYNLGAQVDAIKSRIGFDTLADMRRASPTGGALGQVSDMENKLLAAAYGSLDPNQSPAELQKNLMEVRKHYRNVQELIKNNRHIVNTGVDRKTGRPVEMYSDGTSDYAP